MTLATWLSVATICVLGAMSPGPSLAVVVHKTVSSSRAHGLAAAWAHAAGVGFYALMTTAGLAVLVTGNPAVNRALAVAGAFYLTWLGIKALQAAGTVRFDIGRERAMSLSQAARDGFLIAFLNPKIAVFFLALFSQFVHPGMSVAEHGLLSATATAIDGLWYTTVALILSQAAVLERLRRRVHWVDRLSGVVLIGLALVTLVRVAVAAV